MILLLVPGNLLAGLIETQKKICFGQTGTKPVPALLTVLTVATMPMAWRTGFLKEPRPGLTKPIADGSWTVLTSWNGSVQKLPVAMPWRELTTLLSEPTWGPTLPVNVPPILNWMRLDCCVPMPEQPVTIPGTVPQR